MIPNNGEQIPFNEHDTHQSGVFITVMVSFMVTLVFTSGLFKHYTHRIGRRFVKRTQKDIFDKVMRSPLEPTATQTQLVYVLNTLLEGNFRGMMMAIHRSSVPIKHLCLFPFTQLFSVDRPACIAGWPLFCPYF